jgi:recombination protein RecR
MFKHLPSLQRLITQLQRVPYLASKNVYRIATHFLLQDSSRINAFCRAIEEAKKNINPCKVCFNWAEAEELCPICQSSDRDKSVICVVETWHDLVALEKSGDFKGVYHVLGGALCPLEGIGHNELRIAELFTRIDDTVTEIIFATNATPEGEATASFIASKLINKSIVLSKLASGVPTGSTLEYMDRITIHKALAGRRPF